MEVASVGLGEVGGGMRARNEPVMARMPRVSTRVREVKPRPGSLGEMRTHYHLYSITRIRECG